MHVLQPFLRSGAGVLLLFVSGTRPPAQQTPKSGSTPVTELVDFLAVTEDGKPVTDLAPGEVSFKVDGRLRAISSLQFIELASPTPIARAALTPPLPVPYGSNSLRDIGRVVLIAIDRESIRPGRERPAREAALRFLSGLSPRDRVGLVSLPRVEVELTSDHEQVRNALTSMTGLSPQERTPSEAACRGRLILNTLASMLQSLAALDGPKTIAFISSGIMPPTRDAPMTGPRDNAKSGRSTSTRSLPPRARRARISTSFSRATKGSTRPPIPSRIRRPAGSEARTTTSPGSRVSPGSPGASCTGSTP
jgi:hypothetical protein